MQELGMAGKDASIPFDSPTVQMKKAPAAPRTAAAKLPPRTTSAAAPVNWLGVGVVGVPVAFPEGVVVSAAGGVVGSVTPDGQCQ